MHELIYFESPGFAETSRFCLELSGLEWKNTVVDWDGYMQLKQQGELPWGVLPIIRTPNGVVAESNALLRYTGALAGLEPDDLFTRTKVDELVEVINGWREAFVPTFSIQDMDEKIAAREKLFSEYLSKIGFNADPVLLAYKSNKEIQKMICLIQKRRAEYEFTTSDKTLHKLWVISNNKEIQNISNHFKSINSLYIADGHHRSASSARLSKIKNSNCFMSMLIDEKQLNVFSFNRVIKNTINIKEIDLLKKLKETFTIKKIQEIEFNSNFKNEILLITKSNSFSLIPKKGTYNNDLLSILPTSILSNNILQPIFKMDDNSKEINYINGKIPNNKIFRIVNESKNSLAFILKPTTN